MGDNASSAEGESRSEPPQGRITVRAGVEVGVAAESSDGTAGTVLRAQAGDGCALVDIDCPPCRPETPRRLDTRRNALEAEVTVFERLRDVRTGVEVVTLGREGTMRREPEPGAEVRTTGEAGGVFVAAVSPAAPERPAKIEAPRSSEVSLATSTSL